MGTNKYLAGIDWNLEKIADCLEIQTNVINTLMDAYRKTGILDDKVLSKFKVMIEKEFPDEEEENIRDENYKLTSENYELKNKIFDLESEIRTLKFKLKLLDDEEEKED